MPDRPDAWAPDSPVEALVQATALHSSGALNDGEFLFAVWLVRDGLLEGELGHDTVSSMTRLGAMHVDGRLSEAECARAVGLVIASTTSRDSTNRAPRSEMAERSGIPPAPAASTSVSPARIVPTSVTPAQVAPAAVPPAPLAPTPVLTAPAEVSIDETSIGFTGAQPSRSLLAAGRGAALLLGPAVTLGAAIALTVVVDPEHGPLTMRDLAVGGYGAVWFPPVAVALAGVAAAWEVLRRPSSRLCRTALLLVATAGATAAAAAVVALMAPTYAVTADENGLSPDSVLAPGFWVAFGGLLVSILLTVVDVAWSGTSRGRYVVGPAAVVVVGGLLLAAVGASTATRQRPIELTAAGAPGSGTVATGYADPVPTVASGVWSPPVHPSTEPGNAESLYSALVGRSMCDRDRLAEVVGDDPTLAARWATAVSSTAGTSRGAPRVAPADVAAFIRSLTPVALGRDVRVTDHRFFGEERTVYAHQAVLQVGTAVLVDTYGMPRMRCDSGTPLGPPTTSERGDRYVGRTWQGFDPSHVATVVPADPIIREFGLAEPTTGRTFRRPAATTGGADLVEDPTTALLDGAYELSGTPDSCTPGSCADNTAETVQIVVTGCAQGPCTASSNLGPGSLSVVGGGGQWSIEGSTAEQNAFQCGDRAMPTTFSLTLRARSGQVVDQAWVADQVDGELEEHTDGSAECSDAGFSWHVSGAR